MNLLKLLTTAGVPEALHAQATACLREATPGMVGVMTHGALTRAFCALL